MFLTEIVSVCRHWIFESVFIIAVLSISTVWIIFSPKAGVFFAICFAFCLLLARFFARSKRQRYLFGAGALCTIVAGQTWCPLDYYAFPHIAFNVPFISAYLFPSVWLGAISGLVFGYLFVMAALAVNIPVNAFWEQLIGVVLVPMILHCISYLLQWIIKERKELKHTNEKLQYEINERRRIESELRALAEDLSRKNNELTLALHTIEQTQKQLIRQEKMASIGQVAAGVAHEVNNPLGFITANVETLEQYFTAFSNVLSRYRDLAAKLSEIRKFPLKEVVDLAIKSEKEHDLEYIIGDFPELFRDTIQGLERIHEIVKGMRIFSRIDQRQVFEQYDLIDGLRNTLLVAQNEIMLCVDVEKNIGFIPSIEAIGGELNQVLLNLIVNASQAIGVKENAKRGVIRISTWCDNDSVYCAIEDNGVGIASKNISNIFDPFFTTKPVGQGTGMGLSISYDIIVNHHNGEISVESVEGEGAKFIVKLPMKHKCEMVTIDSGGGQ